MEADKGSDPLLIMGREGGDTAHSLALSAKVLDAGLCAVLLMLLLLLQINKIFITPDLGNCVPMQCINTGIHVACMANVHASMNVATITARAVSPPIMPAHDIPHCCFSTMC